jgi:hypothetical protein
MHHLVKRISACAAWATLMTAGVACGGDDDATGTDNPGVGVAGTSAGKAGSGNTAGKTAIAGKSGTAGSVSPTAGRASGTSGSGASGTAGKTSTAGTGGTGSDEDAGVSPVAGASGTAAVGGSGGVVAAGTGGSAAGSGGAGTGAAGSGSGAATFTQVYAIFMTSCAGGRCHVQANSPAEMLSFVDKATAYTNLVGVNARACAGEKRVVAGDPAKSELVHTLDRTNIGSCSNTPKMPDNLPKLPQAQIDIVKSWVQAGALNN